MGKRKSKKRRLLLLLVCTVLCLAAAGCFAAQAVMGGTLESQYAAERWQGDSTLPYTQLSCYVPVDGKLSLNQVYQFRTEMMKKLHEAALDVDSEETLFVDAWSCTGKTLATTDLGKGDASVIAVGGNFFAFHPLRLISGSYIREGDLMRMAAGTLYARYETESSAAFIVRVPVGRTLAGLTDTAESPCRVIMSFGR